MLPRVNRLLARRTGCAALAAALWLAAPAAHAEEGAALFAHDRWVPSVAIISGAFWVRQHASVSSECRDPGTGDPTSCDPDDATWGSTLRQGDIADELVATPYV